MKITNWHKQHLPAILFALLKNNYDAVLKKWLLTELEDVDLTLLTNKKLVEILATKDTASLYGIILNSAASSVTACDLGAKTSVKKKKTSSQNLKKKNEKKS